VEEVRDAAAARRPAGIRSARDARARAGIALIAACALAACSGSGGGGTAPLPPATVTDLGLIPASISGPGALSRIEVQEASQGADLNGDGDLADTVGYLHDSVARVTRVLEADELDLQTLGDVAVFTVEELGVDLNGDGDGFDSVYHVRDGALAPARGLGLASSFPQAALEGDVLALAVSEFMQGLDGNGDGDLTDVVTTVVHLESGRIDESGLASSPFAVHDGYVGVLLDEADQGADANGDGDVDDTVLHTFDAHTGPVHSSGLAAGLGRLWHAGRFFAHVADEGAHGADLDGDGAVDAELAFLLDPLDGSTLILPGRIVAASNTRIALTVPEETEDRNGDGDLDDHVLVLLEASTAGAMLDTGLAVGPGPLAEFAGDYLVLGSPEIARAADLNGDGDQLDSVLEVVDPSGVVRNLGLAGFPRHANARYAVLYHGDGAPAGAGRGSGASENLVLDGSTGAVKRVGSGAYWALGRERMLMELSERDEGDLDGDGDATESLWVIHDLTTDARRSTGLTSGDWGFAVSSGYDRFLFLAIEWSLGTDVNGDGDLDDPVLQQAE
jgi:hypothetical protein